MAVGLFNKVIFNDAVKTGLKIVPGNSSCVGIPISDAR